MKILSAILVWKIAQLIILTSNGFRSTKQGFRKLIFAWLMSIVLVFYWFENYPLNKESIFFQVIICGLIILNPQIVNFCRKALGKEALDLKGLYRLDDEIKDFSSAEKPWWYYLYLSGWFILICSLFIMAVVLFLFFLNPAKSSAISCVAVFIVLGSLCYNIIKDAKRRQRERK